MLCCESRNRAYPPSPQNISVGAIRRFCWVKNRPARGYGQNPVTAFAGEKSLVPPKDAPGSGGQTWPPLPKLKSNGFEIEAELTARVAHNKLRIFEVPISYYGRTYEEGKKIRWWHGIRAIFAILWFNLIDR